MNSRSLVCGISVLMLAACATNPLVELPAGPVSVGGLQLEAQPGWNANATKDLWTQDGPRLDVIFVYSDVADGQPLEKKAPKQAAFPVFRADMLPNDVVALTESTLTKVFGEGKVLVTSSGLRPRTFGDVKGFEFDLALKASEGPDYRGLAGGFIAEGKLHLVLYLGAEPYYFDLHRDSAAKIIASAQRVR